MRAVGAEDDPEVLLGFLRWQALRLALPLREIAACEQAGPMRLAAAHAVDALQTLLEVIGAGQQNLATATPHTLQAAGDSLTAALANINGSPWMIVGETGPRWGARWYAVPTVAPHLQLPAGILAWSACTPARRGSRAQRVRDVLPA